MPLTFLLLKGRGENKKKGNEIKNLPSEQLSLGDQKLKSKNEVAQVLSLIQADMGRSARVTMIFFLLSSLSS